MLVSGKIKANPAIDTQGCVILVWFVGGLLQKTALPPAVLSLSPPVVEQDAEG